MNNPFATLLPLANPLGIRTRQISVPNCRPGLRVKGPATWERYIEIGDLTLRITNRPRNHDQYQAQLTCNGVSYGKKWYIRKDSPRIKEWLEAIKESLS
jgi:hypothetical protein